MIGTEPASLPPPVQMRSFPSLANTRSSPPMAKMTSTRSVPMMRSGSEVPTLVAGRPKHRGLGGDVAEARGGAAEAPMHINAAHKTTDRRYRRCMTRKVRTSRACVKVRSRSPPGDSPDSPSCDTMGSPCPRRLPVRPAADQLLVATEEMARKQKLPPNPLGTFEAVALYLPGLSGTCLL